VRAELAGRDRVRGEITLLIEAAPAVRQGVNTSQTVAEQVAALRAGEGMDEKDALKRLARELGKSKSELYRELQRERANRR
jgi:16S rRNA (cytidine1402-2'-O)-methyltransferase